MITKHFIRMTSSLLLAGALGAQALAQTPAAAPRVRVERPRPVQVENTSSVPQVVTIIHRLNGLKVIRLLIRGNEQLGAIENLDEAFDMAGDVHMNVIAGLALGDGQTIAAWLPEALAELPPPFAPVPPPPPGAGVSKAPEAKAIEMLPRASFPRQFASVDVKVVTREGKNLSGHYVGLDGITGLSVITLSESDLPRIPESSLETIKPGERVRLIGPEPVAQSEGNSRNGIYVRVGEIEGTVADITRTPSQTLARIRIKSPRITTANIGAVAVTTAGEPVGIVNAIQGDEASVVPVALVRSAAKRVIDRQASVPRPWLGVRGEPIGKLDFEQILKVGWQAERARALAEKQQGIFLTSVVPGSPAATAKLKPGDVILSVNDESIQNADDFSFFLQEAAPGTFVNFEVARPGQKTSEAFKIKLAEWPDSFFSFRTFDVPAFRPTPWAVEGIETIAIRPRVATRLGAKGGLLITYVQPASRAFNAGLRPGDVIEAINGESTISQSFPGPINTTASASFTVVRNKKRMTIAFPAEK